MLLLERLMAMGLVIIFATTGVQSYLWYRQQADTQLLAVRVDKLFELLNAEYQQQCANSAPPAVSASTLPLAADDIVNPLGGKLELAINWSSSPVMLQVATGVPAANVSLLQARLSPTEVTSTVSGWRFTWRQSPSWGIELAEQEAYVFRRMYEPACI